MLEVYNALPEGFLSASARDLYHYLPGPSLIHLSGKKNPALFVSVLLHGNEDTGFEAVKTLLSRYDGKTLPRSLTLLVGNVAAAKEGLRRLDNQPDYNRIWLPGPSPEHLMTASILATMNERGVFA